jgi:hypothetical protein
MGAGAVAATALEDLRRGEVTQAVVDAVTHQAASIARTGAFSAPNGSRDWAAADVGDLVGDFFEKEGRIEALVERAGDGPDAVGRFRGAVQKSLKRLIIDRHRQTPRGVLGRRVERRVRRRPEIVAVPPGHWSFARFEGEPHWGGTDELLVQAAHAVAVDPPPEWPEDSERAAPATSGATVDAACDAVLETAACPVERPLVVRIVVDRVIPDDIAAIAEPSLTPTGHAASPADGDNEEAAQAAARFWEALDDAERQLLPDLRTPARQLEAGGTLGIKKSAIAARQGRLEERVVEFVEANRHGIEAMRVLLRMQQDWATGRTGGGEP